MNRRNFFKVVTGFVAGIFAGSVEGKKRSGTRYVSPSLSPTSTTTTSTSSNYIHICCVADLNDEKLVCYGKNGILCLRCKFNDVRDFGARDDTKLIQEAINLAEESGKVVYFPKGTYNLKYGIIV